MFVVESSGLTDVGQKRKLNEDNFFVDDNLKLYVVADGMGGHQAGEVASEMVVDTIRDYMKRFKEGAPDAVEELEDADEALSQEANRILSSIILANRGVHDVAQSDESYEGMGATVSLAYFTEDALIVANVGDSPVYLVHNGNIELLSVIHNVITEQSAVNPDAVDFISDQYKYLLTRGMGIEETVEPDISEIQYFNGDILVISSDGLTDLVTPEEILEVVNNKPTDDACRILVDMANDRGGHDNVTVVVLKVKSEKEKSWVGKLFSKIGSVFRFFLE
ncbi:MAG: serine/threonine-protein phosphatase [Deltaproteobacteria bacterium]|nr:serine/threonine-protein phosphatase [Deltaproteobacteria bacterium]